jgi:uncharacterized membrane protein
MRSLNFGQTISRASGLIGATLGNVGLFVIVFQIIMGGFNAVFRQQMSAVTEAGAMGSSALFLSGWYWATILVSLVGGAIVFAGATAGMIKADRGETVTIADCLRSGVGKALPAIGLIILWVLGIYAGFILLFVPGCILVAMWSVSFPVLIAEDVGVIGAFGRSRALTKGSRWKIFLLLLLLLVAVYVVFGVVLAGVGFQFGSVAAATSTSLALQIVMGLLGAVFALGNNALLVAIYGELIDLKGDRVSDVFG